MDGIKITRIGNDRNAIFNTHRVVFEYGGVEYTITPSHDGFLLHRGNGENIYMRPVCANEMVVVN
jgi:hypothetical protein